ncbi:MAG: type II toxin-antitoxin system Phd/YefM family antitoxin [Spirochaetota bacterium]|jgi:prevent-host-death family protein|nr:type II toxin-antitoxin system Phd/YefM family antitoxin [Spirochaetota bacterium]
MEQVNIHAAKTHLSALIEKAAAGESFIIAKAGRPLVIVNPYTAPAPPRRIGFMKGRISVPTDFDSLGSEEISALFEGKA